MRTRYVPAGYLRECDPGLTPAYERVPFALARGRTPAVPARWRERVGKKGVHLRSELEAQSARVSTRVP
jgi:hypothetical protein